tara:strand:- start:393 stop:581 length:189 start_codon:yes stop_codon:yes gene_type:complete
MQIKLIQELLRIANNQKMLDVETSKRAREILDILLLSALKTIKHNSRGILHTLSTLEIKKRF